MKKLISLLLCVILTFGCFVSVGAYNFSNNGTATKKATAYRLPSVNSGDVWWVDKNDKLQVFCQDGDYYLVLYPFNNTGKHVIAYVPTSAVSTSGVPSSSNFYKSEIVRTKSNANLYHNPSTDTLTGASGSNQTVRTTVSKGQELTVLFEKDGFYCVRTSNDTGFIEKNKICTHSNTSNKNEKITVAKKDDNTHTVITVYDEVCNDCGKTVESNVKETKTEKHTLVKNKCKNCGYEVPVIEEKPVESTPIEDPPVCKHEKTYTVENSVTYGSTDKDIKVKDDEYHIGYYYADEYCSKCKVLVNKKIIVEQESLHTYWNGVCTSCLHQHHTEKPEETELRINKTSFTPGEKIELNWPIANRASSYDIHIYKEGMNSRYRLDSGFTDNSASIVINDEGVFDLSIYSINNQGYTRGNNIKITVKSPYAEKTAYVYNTDGDNLNMRSQANSSSSIVVKIPAGASLTVTGDIINGFYPVKYNGKTGYASTAYITFTKPSVNKTAYVYNTDGANLNMRSGANKNASIVTKMPEGCTLTVTGDATNGFYPVKYGNHSGYASAAYITFTKPANTNANQSLSNIRTSAPEKNNKYYYSNSNVFYASGLAPYGSRIPSAKGNCTWYAWGRAYELTGTKPQPGLTGNAYTWWNGAAGKYSRGSTPKVGAIAVWKSNMPYSGGCGHVAIVEKIENGKVYISESGYPNTLFKYREIYSTNYLYGYIYIK